jgi:two-component SAPR family response regulator
MASSRPKRKCTEAMEEHYAKRAEKREKLSKACKRRAKKRQELKNEEKVDRFMSAFQVLMIKGVYVFCRLPDLDIHLWLGIIP